MNIQKLPNNHKTLQKKWDKCYYKIIEINDEDAINMSRLLAKKFGLGVGISSGANFLGCVLSEIDDTVTVFTDDLKKYNNKLLNTTFSIEKKKTKSHLYKQLNFQKLIIWK